METLKGMLFAALRVRPMGPTRRGCLVPSLRVYQRIDQCLQLSYPPPKSQQRAIVELRSFLLLLSGGNTASRTQWTIGIYEPLFRNYWFDYHETWQKLSKGVNIEVWKFSQKSFAEFYKSHKTNLILKNKIVSYLKHGIYWVKPFVPSFVLQKCCTLT